MSDDDILGGRLRTTESQSYWESLSLIGRATFFLILAFSIYLAGTFSWNYWKKQQDIAYKKATRRRHGIPDSDKRPFNVAYAAARARLEEEERAAQRPRNILSEASHAMQDSTRERHQTPTWARASGAQARGQSIKPLNGYSNELVNHATNALPGDINNAQSAFSALPFARVSEATKSPSPFPGALHSRRASSRKALSIGPTTDGYTNQSQKRVFEGDEDDGELENYYKKTRVEGEDLIDGDNAAMWNMPDNDDYSNHRGSKRNADYFDEEVGVDGKAVMVANARDKRARKTLQEQLWGEGESLQDAEMMDLSTSMSGSIGRKRGKKRGRPSVLGFGEEDEGDDRSIVSGKRSKRRATVMKGSIDRKGSHDGDDWANELSSNKSRPRNRYNRHGAKKAGSTDESSRLSEEEGSEESDISMNSSSLSLDPRCKGRKIGETWESNGVTYKVGPTGERLRQALVKKEKSKFNMPQDSEHPDSLEHLDIFIETWLTDEEYKDAKDRQELAWQAASVSSVPSRLSIPPASASSIPSTPVAKGKNLLWDSTATAPSLPNSPAVPASARSSASIGSMGQLDVRGRRISLNPFESQALLSPAASNRRVPGLLVGNQRPNGIIIYSKLEKQDLEAEALAKLRQSMKEPEKPSAPAVPSLPSSITVQDKGNAPKSLFPLAPPAANTTLVSTKASMDAPKAPAAAEAPKKDLPPVPLFSAAPANSTTNTKTNGLTSAPPLPDSSASNASTAKPAAPVPSFFAPPASANSNNTTASTTPKTELPFRFDAPKPTTGAPATSTTPLFPTASGSGSTTPSTTVTAPVPASTGSSKPSFAFGPTSGASDSSKSLFPSLSSSSPFGAGPLFPAAGKPGSSATGGQDKTAAASANTPSSSKDAPGGGSLASRLDGFAAPAVPAPAPTSITPASKLSTPSPFGAPSSTGGFGGFGKPTGGDTKPATSMTTTTSDGSKGTSAPVFNFAAPSTAAPSSTSDGNKGTSAPVFSFGAPTAGSSVKTTGDSKSAPLTPTFNFAAPAAAGSSTTSTNDGKAASAPAFGGFGASSKPADKMVPATQVKSTPTPTAFGFSAPSGNTTSASTPAASSSTTNPVFSFGSAKPAAAVTATNATSATTVPQTPFKPPTSASSPLAFSANPSTTPAGQPPAKFGFGGPAAAGSSTAATPITPTTPVKFGTTGGGGGAFAFGTGTQGASNAFGAKPAAGASLFGGGNAGSTKPAFGFGSAPTAPSSSSSTEMKSSASGSGGFTFNFGGNSSTPSPFGAPAASSNVGGNIFGAPSTTTTTNDGSKPSFTFGKTS